MTTQVALDICCEILKKEASSAKVEIHPWIANKMTNYVKGWDRKETAILLKILSKEKEPDAYNIFLYGFSPSMTQETHWNRFIKIFEIVRGEVLGAKIGI